MKWAEALTALAALCGWGLLTWGLAGWSGVVWIWPLSGGLLLLGLAGYRLVWQVLMDGLYLLRLEAQEPAEEEDED